MWVPRDTWSLSSTPAPLLWKVNESPYITSQEAIETVSQPPSRQSPPSEMSKNYTFTSSQDWFTQNIPIWEPHIICAFIPPSRSCPACPRSWNMGGALRRLYHLKAIYIPRLLPRLHRPLRPPPNQCRAREARQKSCTTSVSPGPPSASLKSSAW